MKKKLFLLCISLLFVFSLLPLLLQSFKPSLVQFFSYMVEKSYMFLLCNGLLFLIAINSALINPSSPTTHQTIERVAVAVHIHLEDKFSRLESKEPDIAVSTPNPTESPQEQENVLSDSEEDNALVIIDEDEHETQELNKKCEDFIKRMKATFSSNNLEPRAVDTFYFHNQKSQLLAVN